MPKQNIIFFFLVILIPTFEGKPYSLEDEPFCAGYEACPKTDPSAINVHLIPHSHDDVGWRQTYEEYYYQDVNFVISSVVQALKQKPDRRFIQVETAYFKIWWEEQPESIRQDVINLINSGQLEIIGGAWSMNDEAAVHYQSTIDQFTLGLRYLEDRLGKCSRPKVAWQIDAFGHSREHASLSAHMGFDSLFFGRIDERDKDIRKKTKTMEFIWRGSANLGNSSDIFTSVFSKHYHAPDNFCFDIDCNDTPIIDDAESPDYNYEKRVKEFRDFIEKESKVFATNHILTTLGADLHWRSALVSYINYDKLIKGFELFEQTIDGKKVKLFYSTPSCYAKEVNEYVKSNNMELQIKTDDFFPHAERPNNYWAGYFTSRPASKQYERKANNLLQVAKQLAASSNQPYENKEITSLKEALGVIQHHDAITGTEKQYVTDNYHYFITLGLKKTAEATGKILSAIISGTDINSNSLELDSCLLANISSCPQTDANFFTLVVYNPLAREVSTPISLPIDGDKIWIIFDSDNQEVDHDIMPSIRNFSYANIYKTTNYTLDFMAKDLPPMGYKVYQFQSANGKQSNILSSQITAKIGYEKTNFEMDNNTGLLKTITMNGVTLDVKQDFLFYNGRDNGGHYVFAPTSNDPQRITTSNVKLTQFVGNTSQGVIQEFSDWTRQIIRIYKDDPSYIEFDWIIGPIDMSDKKGKDVITQYTTSLETNAEFYTDANGREILKRKRNFRETFNYTDDDLVASNYYPVNTKIYIKDEKQDIEFAILTDRSEGGSSVKDGQLELMLHRTCDRASSVGESLDEKEFGQGIVVRGKHYMVIGPSGGDGERTLAAIERDIAQKKHLPPWLFLSKKDLISNLKVLKYSLLTKPLPNNVHILTLEPWKENQLLLRLEHVLEKNEDANLSADVSLDLSDLFTTFNISKLDEMTLAANIPLNESKRLKWTDNDDFSKLKEIDDLNVTLTPMQIRTFVATVTFK